jgi:hypothetical protein
MKPRVDVWNLPMFGKTIGMSAALTPYNDAIVSAYCSTDAGALDGSAPNVQRLSAVVRDEEAVVAAARRAVMPTLRSGDDTPESRVFQ